MHKTCLRSTCHLPAVDRCTAIDGLPTPTLEQVFFDQLVRLSSSRISTTHLTHCWIVRGMTEFPIVENFVDCYGYGVMVKEGERWHFRDCPICEFLGHLIHFRPKDLTIKCVVDSPFLVHISSMLLGG